jgi:hypothetical protein
MQRSVCLFEPERKESSKAADCLRQVLQCANCCVGRIAASKSRQLSHCTIVRCGVQEGPKHVGENFAMAAKPRNSANKECETLKRIR